jgi:hypothetical protein
MYFMGSSLSGYVTPGDVPNREVLSRLSISSGQKKLPVVLAFRPMTPVT